MSRVVAIATADLHLCEKPPIARDAEIKDDPRGWFAAMKRPLWFLKRLKQEYKVPILYAGDIFHHWDNSPEMINWAIENLPPGISIAGQHDLPYHRFEEIRKSAYHTLVKSGVLTDISCGKTYENENFSVTGFGWEVSLCRPPATKTNLRIALVHKYLWNHDKDKHPGASPNSQISNLPKNFYLYDLVISGDNHIPFTNNIDQTAFLNCGSLMARDKTQKNYRPAIWLIFSNGYPSQSNIDISKDKWSDSFVSSETRRDPNVEEAVHAFKELKTKGGDFLATLRHAIKHESVRKGVKKVLQSLIDEVKSE